MKLNMVTYKTLTGVKKIVEIPNNTYGKFIIYQDKEPVYLVDCFDFKEDSNQIMNGLLLTKGKTISEVIHNINKEHDVKLSIEKAPLIEIKLASKTKEFKLKPLPLKWLN